LEFSTDLRTTDGRRREGEGRGGRVCKSIDDRKGMGKEEWGWGEKEEERQEGQKKREEEDEERKKLGEREVYVCT
jgi:hypothetical protein